MDRFCWQYLQLEPNLDYPPPELLRTEACQAELSARLFGGEVTHPSPHRYRLRVLKELVRRIEASIDDWDEHALSDDLAAALMSLVAQPLPSETEAAQQRSYVTYHLSLLPGAPAVALLESRNLISAAGTTGLRTWEAALHLGQYLCVTEVVRGKRVLELGAGTGYLSVLCARHLGAEHVVASDGSDDVVSYLGDSLFLNELQGAGRVRVMDLKWGHALVGTEDREWNDGGGVDVVIGADITYDKAIIAPLLGTIGELVGMFPGVEVLIAATERNSETYGAFLEAVERSGDVRVVEHLNFPVDGSKGPFFESRVPIHICRVGRR